MNITFFTLNLFDNGYFDDSGPTKVIERIAFMSWVRKFDVKVFDYRDDVVKDCINEYREIYDYCLEHPGKACIFGDIVRLKVLSLYPYHYYFDCDSYLIDFNLHDKEHFQTAGGCFLNLYNGSDLETAKKILEVYKDGIVQADRATLEKAGLNIPYIHGVKQLHLCGFDAPPKGQFKAFTNNPADIPRLYKKYLELKKPQSCKRLYVYTDLSPRNFLEYLPGSDLLKIKSFEGVQKDDRDIILKEIKNYYLYID